MSLFSNTSRKTLTPTPVKTAPAGYAGEINVIFRMLSLGVLLSLLMALTGLSIFVISLQPVPQSPGTQSGENRSPRRFVQALEALQNDNFEVTFSVKGGVDHDTDG